MLTLIRIFFVAAIITMVLSAVLAFVTGEFFTGFAWALFAVLAVYLFRRLR